MTYHAVEDDQRQVHCLKCWPPYWSEINQGLKRVEIRFNDRDYHVGDELILREWDPCTGTLTGRVCSRTVIHILAGGQFGLVDDHVAMSLYSSEDDGRWP